MGNDFKQVLKSEAIKNEMEIDDHIIEKINIYRQELLEWNKKINLTRITDPVEFARKHVIDCIMLEKRVKISQSAGLIDIGTGPGIPGIMIKIKRPDVKVGLLEAQKKKAGFLSHIINKIGFDGIEIINKRAEDAAMEVKYRESYNVVTARAVSNLCVLSELCLPFVKVGGVFAAMKGEDIDEEIDVSKRAVFLMGGKIEDVIEYEISGDIRRKIVIIRKVAETPGKFPRKPGIPEKSPLMDWKY
jgi:16S rRNA (guanine527-N7)-methyltransferase